MYYPDDFKDGIFAKGAEFSANVDEWAKQLGFNTRVVAFFYDKDDYREEIAELRRVAEYLSNRSNLRIGLVTDMQLVAELKQTHKHLFDYDTMSSMVLVRYDGFIQKLDLSETPIDKYAWWISVKSAKPVDQLNEASYQLTQAAGLPILILFMDFQSSDFDV